MRGLSLFLVVFPEFRIVFSNQELTTDITTFSNVQSKLFPNYSVFAWFLMLHFSIFPHCCKVRVFVLFCFFTSSLMHTIPLGPSYPWKAKYVSYDFLLLELLCMEEYRANVHLVLISIIATLCYLPSWEKHASSFLSL